MISANPYDRCKTESLDGEQSPNDEGGVKSPLSEGMIKASHGFIEGSREVHRNLLNDYNRG